LTTGAVSDDYIGADTVKEAYLVLQANYLNTQTAPSVALHATT